MDLEKLYEKYNILADAKDKIADHSQDYLDALEATKGGDKEKKLSTQIISKFFKHFPAIQNQALNAILDLCEDDDSTIRICAMKVLPSLAKDSSEHLNQIVSVLAQLLQLEDQEYTAATSSLKLVFKDNPDSVLKTIFQYVKTCRDLTVREKCLTFLLGTLITLTPLAKKSEVEDLMIEECKKLLLESGPEEFIIIMPHLTSSKLGKTVSGPGELLNIISDQIEFDQDFDPLEQDTNNTEKIVTCMKYALPLFSAKLESSKYLTYICDQVFPHWSEIGTLEGGELLQYEILRIFAELSVWCGKLENTSVHVLSIFERMKTYMPLPPENVEQSVEVPNFDFSTVECLLFVFHRLARHCPEVLTEDQVLLKDFRARLMYFSRGVQSCKKVLNNKTTNRNSIPNEEKDKFKVAPSMLDNINSLIKDLFYQPPVYKCNVTLSWLTEKKTESSKNGGSGTTQKRHVPITFESNGSTASKQNKGNVKLYTPPSGKFSNSFQYDRPGNRPRGRGGFRGFRGRGGVNRNWRN